MAIESLQANQGIYKVLSKLTGKDYYKTKTGVIIKTDKGKGSVSYDTKTGEITCEGLENAIVQGTLKADKITIVDCKNVKAAGGLGNDEFTIKYSDTVQINGGLGKDEVILYDNPKNVKLTSVEKQTNVTTPVNPERDGIIDGFKQGDITDSKFFSQLISMSQTEEGAKIIKDAIEWDDENRQAIVHCKGLGVDIAINYYALESAKKDGFGVGYSDGTIVTYNYSTGDDDVLLLEFLYKQLLESCQIDYFGFKCADSSAVFNPYTFLAGVKYDTNYLTEASQIEEALNKLESDKGEKLVSNAQPKSKDEIEVTDANGKKATLDPNQTYAIAEVKNGLVTVINPKNTTNDSEYTQTFTYEEFSKYFNITNPIDISKTSDIAPEIQIFENDGLSYNDIKIIPTTAKVEKAERNGEIEWSKQGGIGDCWCLSEINSMSYTEEGRRIIKESIVWDDENQQAIVHCKGLGIDMVVSYDELKEAEENGDQYYEKRGGQYSSGDDDIFLLEYIMAKFWYLTNNCLVDFVNYDITGSGPIMFLAGVEHDNNPISDEEQMMEILKRLEEDAGKNLAASAGVSLDKLEKADPDIINQVGTLFEGQGYVIDSNGKKVLLATNHAYAIKDIKDGYVTVINPWSSSDSSQYTATFTYEDFCKYFHIEKPSDLSQPLKDTPEIYIKEGSFSDYGIIVTTAKEKTHTERNGVIEWSNQGWLDDDEFLSELNAMSYTQDGAKRISKLKPE